MSGVLVIAARQEVEHLGALIVIAASAMVIVASMWWLYFDRPQHHLLGGIGSSLRWGYGHYLVFAGAAAVSVGVQMALDADTGATVLSASQAAAVATVPIAVFIATFWLLALRPERDRVLDAIALGGAIAVAAATVLPHALPIAAGLLALTVLAVSRRRSRERTPRYSAPDRRASSPGV